MLYTTNSISTSEGLFNENKYIKKTFNNFINDKNNTEISFLSGQNRFKIKQLKEEKELEEFKENYLNSLNPKDNYILQKKYKIKNTDKLYTGSVIPHKLKKIKNSKKYNLGPGEYDINPKWSKNIIKWSNLTEERFQPIKKNENVLNEKEKIELNIYNTNQNKINQNLVNNIKNMKNELFKSLQDKRKNLFDFYKEELYTKTTNNISTNFRNYDDTFLPHKFFKQQKFQYFGSTSPRFPNEGNKNNINSYTNDIYKKINEKITSTSPSRTSNNYKHLKGASFNNKPHKNKETYIIKPGINGLVISNNENHCEINNINNSSFENDILNNQIYSQFNKAMKLDDKCFNSQEVRFKYSNNDEYNLGPGEYFRDEYINEKKIFYNLNKQKNKNNFNSNNNIIDNFLTKKDDLPAVGSYNLNNYSIENNLNKIKKKYRNNKIPFNSNNIRFNYKITNEDKILGPGYYDINNKDNIKNIKIMPEHKSNNIAKKFDNFQKQNMGPGQYNLDSYFDWNYKSYNKKFN